MPLIAYKDPLKQIRLYDLISSENASSVEKYSDETFSFKPNDILTINHPSDTKFERFVNILKYDVANAVVEVNSVDSIRTDIFDISTNDFLQRDANGNIMLITTYSEGGESVFDFYDDFSDGIIDTNKWTVRTDNGTLGVITEDASSSSVKFTKSNGSGPLLLKTNYAFPTNTIVEAKLSDTPNVVNFLSMNNGQGGIDIHVGNKNNQSEYIGIFGTIGLGEVYNNNINNTSHIIAKITRKEDMAEMKIYDTNFSHLHTYSITNSIYLNPSNFNLQVNYSSNGTTVSTVSWARVRKVMQNMPTPATVDINTKTFTITNNNSSDMNGVQVLVDISPLGDLSNRMLKIMDDSNNNVPYVYNPFTGMDVTKFYTGDSQILIKVNIPANSSKTYNYEVYDIPYNQEQVFTTNISINTDSMTKIFSLTPSMTSGNNSSIKVLISFDNKQTWKTFNGTSFITTSIESITTEGMDSATISSIPSTAFQPYVDANAPIDFAISMLTNDKNDIPIFDRIDINYTSSTYSWTPVSGMELEQNFEVKMYNENTMIKNIGTHEYKIKANVLI